MAVVAYVPDLIDRSKVASAAPGTVFAGSPDALVAGAGDVVVVDVGRPGALEALPGLVATGARVIAFGSHVDRTTLAAAREAGCTEVLARSAFFRDLPSLLG